jgi:hypothetical protein
METPSRISPIITTSGSCRNTAHLALRNDAPVLREKIFHRIFDGDDVIGTRVIDLVDDRRERGRFAVPGRTHQEHESLRELGEIVEQRRKT